MKKNKVDELLKRYEEGKTSISEENFLFENAGDENTMHKGWGIFRKKNKLHPPQNLQKSVLDAIRSLEAGKRRLRIVRFSIAASVLIALGVTIGLFKNTESDYKGKEIMLQEALAMLEDNITIQGETEVIYEGELVVIYTIKE